MIILALNSRSPLAMLIPTPPVPPMRRIVWSSSLLRNPDMLMAVEWGRSAVVCTVSLRCIRVVSIMLHKYSV